MACFIAPLSAAIITTVAYKKINERLHLDWLITMLWGGVVMLAIEHIVHGEVTLYPPFLTALKNPGEAIVMLREIASVGIPMTLAIVATWGALLLVKRTKLSKNNPA
jgi:hypothetical protein